MKKIIGLVVVLAAIILGGYYGMGLVTERTIKRNIEVVNKSGNNMLIDLKEYKRHWFGSEAAVDVKVHVVERVTQDENGKSKTIPAEDYTLNVPVFIYHGPVMHTEKGIMFGLGYAQSHLVLPKELADKFSAFFSPDSTQPELNLSFYVNYFNKSRLSLGVPAFKLIDKDGKSQADWLGMNGDIAVSSDSNNIDGNFTVDGFKITKDNLVASVGPTEVDFDSHKSIEGLYVGRANTTMPSVLIRKNDVTLFELDKYKMNANSDIKDGLLDFGFDLTIEKVLANAKTYGPGQLTVSLRNLDALIFASINAHAQKMQNSSGTQRQQEMFAMLPELPKLFSKGAKFEISTLKVAMPEGAIDGKLSVELPKGEPANPFQIMQRIEGMGKFQVPAAIVRNALIESIIEKETANTSPQVQLKAAEKPDQATTAVSKDENSQVASAPAVADETMKQATTEADKKIATLVQAKILIEQGSDYVIEFSLSKGQLNVNGSPFDPSSFKF